ncbi:MAG TPA: hypothetical protein PLX97_16275, partial [Gemmatales bacterium]|nr:hypothetical protein [Gemmatales bacterium]
GESNNRISRIDGRIKENIVCCQAGYCVGANNSSTAIGECETGEIGGIAIAHGCLGITCRVNEKGKCYY